MVALVDKQAVNPQLLKGHEIILFGAVVQLFQPRFQRFPGAFHLLNGEILAFGRLGLLDAEQNFVDLPLQGGLLPLSGHGGF